MIWVSSTDISLSSECRFPQRGGVHELYMPVCLIRLAKVLWHARLPMIDSVLMSRLPYFLCPSVQFSTSLMLSLKWKIPGKSEMQYQCSKQRVNEIWSFFDFVVPQQRAHLKVFWWFKLPAAVEADCWGTHFPGTQRYSQQFS